jgi:hypothetical protein
VFAAPRESFRFQWFYRHRSGTLIAREVIEKDKELVAPTPGACRSRSRSHGLRKDESHLGGREMSEFICLQWFTDSGRQLVAAEILSSLAVHPARHYAPDCAKPHEHPTQCGFAKWT